MGDEDTRSRAVIDAALGGDGSAEVGAQDGRL
jgi:hypothetical protein